MKKIIICSIFSLVLLTETGHASERANAYRLAWITSGCVGFLALTGWVGLQHVWFASENSQLRAQVSALELKIADQAASGTLSRVAEEQAGRARQIERAKTQKLVSDFQQALQELIQQRIVKDEDLKENQGRVVEKFRQSYEALQAIINQKAELEDSSGDSVSLQILLITYEALYRDLEEPFKHWQRVNAAVAEIELMQSMLKRFSSTLENLERMLIEKESSGADQQELERLRDDIRKAKEMRDSLEQQMKALRGNP
jgi:hypothetical protein